MAHIAVAEPQADVRLLIEHVLDRIGHTTADERDSGTADAFLVEPASPYELELAMHARRRRPDLPIICVSIEPPSPEALALNPAVYLMKPFTLAGLRAAIETALNQVGSALRVY